MICRRKWPPVGGDFRRQIIYNRCTQFQRGSAPKSIKTPSSIDGTQYKVCIVGIETIDMLYQHQRLRTSFHHSANFCIVSAHPNVSEYPNVKGNRWAKFEFLNLPHLLEALHTSKKVNLFDELEGWKTSLHGLLTLAERTKAYFQMRQI